MAILVSHMLACPDVSEFQTIVTDRYGRRILIFRAAFGAHYEDQHFLENANRIAAMYKAGEIDGAVCYTVYLGSASPAEQYAYFWYLMGPVPPPWLIAVMIDVEHWGGTSYTIWGNHSKQVNQLAGMHANKMKSWRAVWIYANAGDLAAIVPQRDKRLPVIVARYGTSIALTVAGQIGVQYTDGQSKWGVPKGLPLSSVPFGNCDHNVFPKFTSAKQLRDWCRPPTTVKVPAKHTPPPPPRAPYPLPTGGPAGSLVDATGYTRFVPLRDGRFQVIQNHKTIGFTRLDKVA